MKLTSLFLTSLAVTHAFSPQSTSRSTSSLNLFGGGGGGGEKKGPGMMDQLAMFKKAQEVAKKKQKLDEELKLETFSGTGADGKVSMSFKFMPVINPMDPNPDYDIVSIDFDDAYYESASAEELSEAVKDAYMSGIKTTNEAVAAKYQTLQADLMDAFGGQKGQ